MSYVTLPENHGTGGIFDMFSGKKKKKAKKKAKAEKKKAEEELKKMDEDEKKAIAAESGDPSKRGAGIGARVSSDAFGIQSIPTWMIYAGAGAAVLGIVLWRKK